MNLSACLSCLNETRKRSVCLCASCIHVGFADVSLVTDGCGVGLVICKKTNDEVNDVRSCTMFDKHPLAGEPA